MSTAKELEFPRWVYPPDGGEGCIVQTPDEVPKGWLPAPIEPGPQSGERVIGQPTEFPKAESADDDARKSKKK